MYPSSSLFLGKQQCYERAVIWASDLKSDGNTYQTWPRLVNVPLHPDCVDADSDVTNTKNVFENQSSLKYTQLKRTVPKKDINLNLVNNLDRIK